jgi:hypothetical protein
MPGQRRVPKRQNFYNYGHLIQLSGAVKRCLQLRTPEFAKKPRFFVARGAGNIYIGPVRPAPAIKSTLMHCPFETDR